MAHFARMNGNVVEAVIVVCNCAIGGCIGPEDPIYHENPNGHINCGSLDFPDTEPLGQAMLAQAGFLGTYVQCSYNANFRGAYPSAGWLYDPELDEFIHPARVSE